MFSNTFLYIHKYYGYQLVYYYYSDILFKNLKILPNLRHYSIYVIYSVHFMIAIE